MYLILFFLIVILLGIEIFRFQLAFDRAASTPFSQQPATSKSNAVPDIFIKDDSGGFLPTPLNDRALTRAVIMYIPSGDLTYYKQAHGFIESWVTLFHKPVSLQTERMLNESKVSQQDTIFISDRRVVIPWLENARRKLEELPLADPPEIQSLDKTNRIALVDGPPLITDIFVFAPLDFSSTHKHPMCDSYAANRWDIGSNGELELISFLNVTNRLMHAKQRLLNNFYNTKNWNARSIKEKTMDARLGESRCFYILTDLPTNEAGMPFSSQHPAMHSIGVLRARPALALSKEYDIMLRSDADCFLAPHFNDPRLIPWKYESLIKEKQNVTSYLRRRPYSNNHSFTSHPMFTGTGGYSGTIQNKALHEYAEFLGLRYQDLHSIGSTWYGYSKYLTEAAALSINVAEFLLRNDAVFKHTSASGRWPEWYKGVMSMYGGEMAVNHLFDKETIFTRPYLLDSQSTMNVSFSKESVMHIHCWHTSAFYSKFASYPWTLMHTPEFNFALPSWFSYSHSVAGALIDGYLTSFTTPKPSGPPLLQHGHLILEIAPMLEKYLGCPDEFKYSYYNGTYCCSSNLDCANNPLKYESDCCYREQYVQCPIAEGCSNERVILDSLPKEVLHPNVEGIQQQIRNQLKKFIKQTLLL